MTEHFILTMLISNVDIKNHVYRAKRALDQENLRLKIKEWEEHDRESTFFFHPYISSEDSETHHQSSEEVPKEEKKKEDTGFKETLEVMMTGVRF